MKHLNLTHTCLMDVSGELSTKAAAQLHEHTAKFPAALLEYELVRGQFELLKSLPKEELPDEAKRRIADGIKRGIHRELTRRHRERISAMRWRWAYRAMAGVTGIAACLVIAATVYLVNQDAQRRERESIAKAAESLSDYLATDSNSQTEQDVRGVADDIAAVANHNNNEAVAGAGDAPMRLMDALSGEQTADAVNNPHGI